MPLPPSAPSLEVLEVQHAHTVDRVGQIEEYLEKDRIKTQARFSTIEDRVMTVEGQVTQSTWDRGQLWHKVRNMLTRMSTSEKLILQVLNRDKMICEVSKWLRIILAPLAFYVVLRLAGHEDAFWRVLGLT